MFRLSASRSIRAAALAAVLVGISLPAAGQGVDYVREHYTKSEQLIPARDGTQLFVSLYEPKDRSKPYPIMLTRTPYSVAPYGPDAYRDSLGPSSLFASEGFIFAYADVRGRYMSEGEFVNMTPHLDVKKSTRDVDESTDTYDTIDWLVKNVPNNNGRVGMWGISYPGFYTAAGMIDAHEALKASSPQAPISDWFVNDDFHHNGALYLPHFFNFIASFGKPRPKPTTRIEPRFDHGTQDGYAFFLQTGAMPNFDELRFKYGIPFWTEALKHETYDDFWQARNLRPHLKDVKHAVLTVGGWFDAEDLFGALEVYKWTEKLSPEATNTLVMGPWFHGGWARGDGDRLGDVTFDAKTSAFYRERIELPFFMHHLKGAPDPGLAEAFVFETGANRWRQFDAWPPKTAAQRSLYAAPGGKLAWEPPTDTGSRAYDEYVSDPAKPVPYINDIAIGMTREHMVADQRFAASRPDVLVYQTDVLADDLTLAGPIVANLTVSTSGTDSDWVVKVIDVYPNDAPDPSSTDGASASATMATRMGGYQQLVRGEPFRGKFRNSFSKPEPFVPGQPTHVEWTMPDVFHTFRKGHRLMVQIQSSWFPLVNRNPQVFTRINDAPDAAYQKATQRVYRSAALATSLKLSVLAQPPSTAQYQYP
ncbi:MAG: CocE/NonD family hydrolase [Vicinamibacterales bacterium]